MVIITTLTKAQKTKVCMDELVKLYENGKNYDFTELPVSNFAIAKLYSTYTNNKGKVFPKRIKLEGNISGVPPEAYAWKFDKFDIPHTLEGLNKLREMINNPNLDIVIKCRMKMDGQEVEQEVEVRKPSSKMSF